MIYHRIAAAIASIIGMALIITDGPKASEYIGLGIIATTCVIQTVCDAADYVRKGLAA